MATIFFMERICRRIFVLIVDALSETRPGLDEVKTNIAAET